MESINVTTICDKEVDKDKETLSVYAIKVEENTSSASDKKDKARDGYAQMYEYKENLLHSMYKRTCAAYEITISQMKEIVEIFYSEIQEIRSTNWYMQDYIDIFHKESERHAEYPEQSTGHFEKVANITVDSNSLIIH